MFVFFFFSFPPLFPSLFSRIFGWARSRIWAIFSPYDTDVYGLRASGSLLCVCVLCIICHVQLPPFYVTLCPSLLFCSTTSFSTASSEKRIKPAVWAGEQERCVLFYILSTIKKDCGFGFYVFRGVFFFFIYICSLIFFIYDVPGSL